MFVLYPFWFSLYLLVVVLLLLPFDFLISLPGMLTRHVTLSSPKFLEKGDDGIVVITTHQRSKYPIRQIKVRVKFSGDYFSAWRRFLVGANDGDRYEISIDTSHTGISRFETTCSWAVSIIGLICMPAKISSKASTLILPAPEKPPNTVPLPRGIILKPKPGGGFSEDYDMRPYRLGDPIRSVHWKVSAKFDSLIIREPLIPPAHSRLLHIQRWNDAKERDLILSRLRWVSDYMLKWDLAYFIRLGDDGPIAEISANADLMNYLFLVLSNQVDDIQTPATIPVHFAWVYRVTGV